ncbi:hypothetical protein [Rodentibacter abscessus]|uniref:hypothetical protein n=1 Tax=Rodentibacter abscessus TaxID=3381777 RepID=UPI00399C63B7
MCHKCHQCNIKTAQVIGGDIKDFTVLDQDGQTVCAVAYQLHETIRLKLGRRFADYLSDTKA